MKRTTATRVAALVLVAFVGLLFYWVDSRRAKDVELVYDLSRLGRTDLVELHVEIRRSGELVRDARFFYSGGEGGAPSQQRHTLTLPEGAMVAHFGFRFAKALPETRTVPFVLPAQSPVVLAVPPNR
jgi:hypothetical protein